MTVTLDGSDQPLKFWFRYERSAATVLTTVYCENSSGRMWSAYARCAATDQFVKAKGRRIALARLLNGWALTGLPSLSGLSYPVTRKTTRAERAIIWSAYFAVHADLKKKQRAHKGAA